MLFVLLGSELVFASSIKLTLNKKLLEFQANIIIYI